MPARVGWNGWYRVEVEATWWRERIDRSTVGGKRGGGAPPPVDVGCASVVRVTVAAVVKCIQLFMLFSIACLLLLDSTQYTNSHCRSDPEGVFGSLSGIVNTCWCREFTVAAVVADNQPLN